MCGRYVSEEDQSIDLGALYRAVRVEYPQLPLASGEIFPTNTVPLLIGTTLTPAPATWGYQGFEGKGIIINARAETAAQKPTFRGSVRGGRCVIPATGYFEWSQSGEKHLFSPAGSELLFMAGLFRMTPEGRRFVILTTASTPAQQAAAIHPRMPLLLPALSVGDWMRDACFAARYLTCPAVGAVPLTCSRVG